MPMDIVSMPIGEAMLENLGRSVDGFFAATIAAKTVAEVWFAVRPTPLLLAAFAG